MFPILETITENDLETLAALDAEGLLMAPGEDFESCLRRISGLFAFGEKIEQELAENQVFALDKGFNLPADKRIAPEILEEAAAITDPLYAIAVRWVPGFFLSRNLGIFWGGCSYTDSGSNLNVFLIRGSFARKKRWFIYRRDELTAHELCHAARSVLNDDVYEEYFAYQTSPFRGRRYLGPCFRTRFDALFFLGPVLLLLLAELGRTFIFYDRYPIWPFWSFAGFFPSLLLIRNQLERNLIKRAVKLLAQAGIRNPMAILFRCTAAEIKRFARLNSCDEIKNRIDDLAKQELRWRLIKYRFVEEHHHEHN